MIARETFAEVRRRLNATPERVFAAFADAGLVARWLSPSPEIRLTVLQFDFREGGEYIWSVRIFPKAGFLLQLSENGGWQYRPKAVKPSGTWQTLTASFTGLKSKQTETLALCFPPGDGFVDIKAVSLDGR